MPKNYKIYLIIFLLSAVILTFEIILARVFSYILTYHFVYIIIAIAILSHALGQLYASRVVMRKSYSLPKYFTIFQILFPISIVTIFVLPSIDIIGSAATGIILYTIIAGTSFFMVGLISAIFLHEYKNKISILYALDLIGAAMGSLFGLFLLNNFSLITSISVILLIISMSSLLSLSHKKNKKNIHIFTNLIILLFSIYIALFTPAIKIPMAKSTDKDLLRLQNNPNIKSKIVETQWNSFGRTDLVKFTYPDSSQSMSMFIDGAAGTEIINIAELEQDSVKLLQNLRHSNLYFPFYFLKDFEKDSALIIGPGGGLDIAVAYFGNVEFIDAVEVNPTFVDMMKIYNKSTFSEHSNINVIVQEGRNYVRNTPNKYDLIFLTIPITKGVRSTDYINLTENYLFTLNALEDYLSILTNEGRIVLTLHNREEVYKVLSNYLEIQLQNGIPNSLALNNIYVVDRGMKPLLVIKKNAFLKNEIIARLLVSRKYDFDRGITFFPLVAKVSNNNSVSDMNDSKIVFDKILYDVSNNKYNFHDLSSNALINLHPVYDDAPFFFNYELGVPQNLNPLIFVGIILSVISVYMFKKNWGLALKNTQDKKTVDKRTFKLLSMIAFILGFSYILIQSYLFQKLNLYLSSPLNSFSILLFSFLLGGGIGSLLSNRITKNRIKYVGLSIVIIITVIFLENLWLADTSSTSLSVFVLGLIVFIPAIFIGLPFPLILAEANLYYGDNGIPILLGISGIAGFIGGVTVLVLAMTLGYFYIVTLSLALYFILAVVLFVSKDRVKSTKDNQHLN